MPVTTRPEEPTLQAGRVATIEPGRPTRDQIQRNRPLRLGPRLLAVGDEGVPGQASGEQILVEKF